MGSVKDLQVLVPPAENAGGLGRFHFSDRYSVFDWGEMPDHIPQKGASLCILSAYFFELLEEKGVKTHYRGLVENGQPKKLSLLAGPSSVMEVRLVRVIRPEPANGGYDYAIFRKETANLLVPLEVIYRRALPEGSSVFRRLEEGTLTPAEIGLKEPPRPGQVLERPVLDVSTKLEPGDRYLSWREAQEMAGLSDGETAGLKETALAIGELIAAEAEKAGLFNEDGKVEFAFDEHRRLMVVDAVGTLDECRFAFQGVPVSKEVARIYYRRTPWYGELEKAKKRGGPDWKKMVQGSPPPLPPRLKELISMLYCGCANLITGRTWFPGVPPLAEIIGEIKKTLAE